MSIITLLVMWKLEFIPTCVETSGPAMPSFGLGSNSIVH